MLLTIKASACVLAIFKNSSFTRSSLLKRLVGGCDGSVRFTFLLAFEVDGNSVLNGSLFNTVVETILVLFIISHSSSIIFMVSISNASLSLSFSIVESVDGDNVVIC